MSRTTQRPRTPHGVMVGVDGTAASVHAVRYAAREAARLGEDVDVVHVVPEYVPIAGLYPLVPDDAAAAGSSIVDSTLKRAGRPVKAVTVTSHVDHGVVVPRLVAAGRQARVVVLGSDRRPVSVRLLTGNVSTGVAARCPAPVVSVPGDWGPEQDKGVVLAAVKHPRHADAVMAEAFEVARERGGRVVVLHAWQLPFPYDDNLRSDREALEDWRRALLDELHDLVAPWQDKFPEVDVTVVSEQAQAAHALVAASEQVDEVVLERRSHGVPAAAHLGSTGRTVLLHARCPVRVVPTERVPADSATAGTGQQPEGAVG